MQKISSHWRLSDLRGLAQLGVDATIGVTDLVEQLHTTIARRAVPGIRPLTAANDGISGLVYASIRGIARGASLTLDGGLSLLERRLPSGQTGSPQREAVLAALNGIYGDHLAASGNPLAIEMGLSIDGRRLPLTQASLATLTAPSQRLLLLVHGLCMNDQQWHRQGHHHGERLAREHGYSVLAVHYNSGLRIADNAAQLAELLARVQRHWPLPVQQLAIVGHSMGGLVARAAIAEAERHGLSWREHLTALVCLGTPHQGAALERGGHLLDTLLEFSPYAAPFARLGKSRSVGITDLRHGRLQSGRAADTTPLPQGVPVYAVAATRAEKDANQPPDASAQNRSSLLPSDGLVSVASAWGEHRDPARALPLPTAHKRLLGKANHWDLLSREEVAEWLSEWLAPRSVRRRQRS